MTLTLPIQVGRRYVRRDGIVITASEPHPGVASNEPIVYVGMEPKATRHQGFHAYIASGAINMTGPDSMDLVADYIEPAAIDAELPKGHPHAALMALYAQDAAETAEPWERWENRPFDIHPWTDLTSHPAWLSNAEYRRKVKTIRIGDFDVPEPLRKAPALGTPYFYPSPTAINPVGETQWNLPSEDERLLKRGLCHLTREAAELHALALLSFTQVTGAPD